MSKAGSSTLLHPLAFALFFSCSLALADDTEIFVGGGGGGGGPVAQPNILFVIDTSGSMDNEVDGDPLSRDRLAVVQDVTKDLLDQISGVNVGLMQFSANDSYDSQDDDAEGGMIIQAMGDIASNRDAMKEAIDGLHHYGYTPLSETLYEAALYFIGDPVSYGLDSKQSYEYCRRWRRGNCRDWRQDRRDFPSVAASRTGDGPDGGNHYLSPIDNECQANFIVYLTDGAPTQDSGGNSRIETLLSDSRFDAHPDRSCANDHGDTDGMCLDELAGLLYENDLSELPGKQNVRVYTIGFNVDLPLLEDTALRGGGAYYQSDDAAQLTEQLTEIVQQIQDVDASFTSPAVSIDSFDRSSHLDQVYFALFKPGAGRHWDGNLKKYRLATPPQGEELDVVDIHGNAAVDQDTGFFIDNSQSFWSPEMDGADITWGGAAALLGTTRNTLTTNENQVMIALHESNAGSFEGPMLGLGEATRPQIEELLAWARGVDVDDEDEDGDATDARGVMGDPMHSRPLIVTYGPGGGGDEDNPDVVVYFGTNDGYLHAIDGDDGAERFAFMPRELLANLGPLRANVGEKTYGVDGPITAWIETGGDGTVDASAGDFVYVYFGLRRGGSHYYALDLTNPDNPRYLWSLSPQQSGFERLGQTWSPPTLANVSTSSFGERTVLVFGGGYDTRQDGHSAHAPDTKGNAIYMADASTGQRIWFASSEGADTVLPDMQNAIPGGIRVLDLDLDGFADRMYAADLGGRVWRLDIHNARDAESSFRVTGGVLASLGGAASTAPSDNRRFYYAPDVALGSAYGDSFFNVAIGSGYRAHPLDTSVTDYLYVVRDYYPFTALGHDPDEGDPYPDLYGITHGQLESITVSDATIAAHSAGLRLPLLAGGGEKSLAEARVFQNEAMYTTFSPEGSASACAASLGVGRLYSIPLNGGAVDTEELDNPGIPPEVIFVFDDDPEPPNPDPPDCYGEYCNPPPDECDQEDDCEDPDGDGPPERQVKCLAGPEACDAGSSEAPVRTFWVEVVDEI